MSSQIRSRIYRWMATNLIFTNGWIIYTIRNVAIFMCRWIYLTKFYIITYYKLYRQNSVVWAWSPWSIVKIVSTRRFTSICVRHLQEWSLRQSDELSAIGVVENEKVIVATSALLSSHGRNDPNPRTIPPSLLPSLFPAALVSYRILFNPFNIIASSVFYFFCCPLENSCHTVMDGSGEANVLVQL